jgi:hypothetical protein
LCFSPGQVAHYNKTTLKNHRIFHHFEKSSYFSPLWKISAVFTSLKNLCVFHLSRSPITIRPPSKKPFFNFLWVSHPWQFDHFKISEFSKEKSSSFYSECTF